MRSYCHARCLNQHSLFNIYHSLFIIHHFFVQPRSSFRCTGIFRTHSRPLKGRPNAQLLSRQMLESTFVIQYLSFIIHYSSFLCSTTEFIEMHMDFPHSLPTPKGRPNAQLFFFRLVSPHSRYSEISILKS
jgi:hypothetical protein